MALIVQKYGGSSVGSIERIHGVAEKIIKTRSLGNDLVVVVSAMSGETDRLVSLANKLSNSPDPREIDVLLATGEQVSIALLSLALIDRGCPARSYTGSQVHIRTDNIHTKARILRIDESKIRGDLSAGRVVVIAGFQGMDLEGNITTLGRGGSDTTAVALAGALKAAECQIYTDVDGVYTTDPRVVPEARRMRRISFNEMLELSSQGAKVMQMRAVEFAGKYNVPVRVLSTFQEGEGTLISHQEQDLTKAAVSGIAFNREEAKFILRGLSARYSTITEVLGPLCQAHIEIDLLAQYLSTEGTMDLAFTVHRRDYQATKAILHQLQKSLQAEHIIDDNTVAKLSLVGVGLRSNVSVMDTLLRTLEKEGAATQLFSTSEIKVSVVIPEAKLESSVRSLHRAFQLEQENTQAMGGPNNSE